ncbi:MAG: hypothetical protein ABIH76_08385 [Candidatus Bathyarchaeota archaeon]
MKQWDKTDDWFWEGNVLQRIIEHMQEQEGYSILRVCFPGEKGQFSIRR